MRAAAYSCSSKKQWLDRVLLLIRELTGGIPGRNAYLSRQSILLERLVHSSSPRVLRQV